MKWLKLLRVHQYFKNLFVFSPLFFVGGFTNIDLVLKAFIGFIVFSMASSGVYILNDIKDIEEDKHHPVKSKRPIASGQVKVKTAVVILIILLALSLVISYFVNLDLFTLLIGYIALNILYSFKLKHISIVDITVIAIGFLIRVVAGAIITDVKLTIWIILVTFLLALFLALAKRRDDVILYSNSGKKTRLSIDGYNLEFINSSMTIMASVTVVSYIFYTISPEAHEKFHSNCLFITALFVIVGIMRYLQITFVENKSGSPTEVLLKDKFLQITIFAWILTFIFIIY